MWVILEASNASKVLHRKESIDLNWETIFDYGIHILIEHIKKHFEIQFLLELRILQVVIKLLNDEANSVSSVTLSLLRWKESKIRVIH